MKRREFLSMTGLAAGAAFAGLEPKLSGKEFQGMEGAFAPLFTPYKPDGSVNLPMVGRMIEWLLAKGMKGFYVCGGTGEHILLSVQERKMIAEAAIEAVARRAKVIVHVGATATRDSVELAKHAEKAGADWISSLGPIFFGQNFNAAYHHFNCIAGATALPLMVYCWGRDLDPESERRLYDIPNLKGMKYTGRNFWTVQELKRKLNKEAVFFVGDDPHLLGGLSMNGVFSGGIGTTYNVIPAKFAEICRLAKLGKFEEAAKIQDAANAVTYAISTHSNFTYRKLCMKHLGFDCGFARSPFGQPVTPEEEAAFLKKVAPLIG